MVRRCDEERLLSAFVWTRLRHPVIVGGAWAPTFAPNKVGHFDESLLYLNSFNLFFPFLYLKIQTQLFQTILSQVTISCQTCCTEEVKLLDRRLI